MSSLIHATFVKDESHDIEMMLETILPYVDGSYVMIDDRTKDNTKELAEAMGCHTKLFRFENFGKTKNTLYDWVSGKSDWVFGLAPDEKITPDFGEELKVFVGKINPTDVDGVWFCRRHWSDLEMKQEYTKQNWYPDWQLRLIRNAYPRIHFINYVHEWQRGLRKEMRIQADIHHFNMYWKPRIDYDFEAMNQLYNKLKLAQRKDGGKNIWPE